MTQNALTPASFQLFRTLAEDAIGWGGTPLWDANFGWAREDWANLEELKVKGLLWTIDEGNLEWVDFTDEGKALAASLGIEIDRAW